MRNDVMLLKVLTLKQASLAITSAKVVRQLSSAISANHKLGNSDFSENLGQL